MAIPLRDALKLGPLVLIIFMSRPSWSDETTTSPHDRNCHAAAELFCAIGNFDNVKLSKLVSTGLDVNAHGPKGGYEGTDPDVPDLPLCLAVRLGNLDAVHILIEHHADVNGDCFGSSPLSEAAGEGQEQALDYLLDHGANPNKIDTDNYPLSPLMHCAYGPNGKPNDRGVQRRMLKRLLAAGANPTYVLTDMRWKGRTALSIAEGTDTNDVVMAQMLRRAIKQWKNHHGAPE